MDPKQFTPEKTGELRQFHSLVTGRDEWLFLPDEMPPKWEFPVRLWPLLSEASTALGTLNGIGQTLPNPELLLRPLQSREAITSSRIEGTYVTPEQLLLYELDPSDLGSSDERSAEWREVSNYSRALRQGCDLLEELPIASRLITSIHSTLMSGTRGPSKSPGKFRSIQVQIGVQGKYVPPLPPEIHRLMGNLENFINSDDSHYDPLILCYLTHYQFEAIHPFIDGNGRVGRALLSLMTYRKLQLTMPWLYMSAFFEQHREEYTDKLFRVSTHGDWDSWIELCLYGTVVQANDAIARCDLFNQMRQRFRDQISAPTSRTSDIVEGLFHSPVVTIPYLKRRFGIHYQTAQKDVERLVFDGILAEMEGQYPRSFYAPALFRIAYSDSPVDITEEDIDSGIPR
ncbi:MAG: Fic family protein [Planctomycetes bacterium]|nr:Fic family protein [Planctomycetota bacterium]